MPRILVADPIANEGLELLRAKADVDVKVGLKSQELLHIVGEYEALIVRSETKVTAEVINAGERLQVIARAGIGVDNIDLDAATSAGIAVVNAPTGNTVAAAEHTLALILAMSRNIPLAHQSLREGEWRRSDFMGIEVQHKTLGIVGLGRVGSEVARRAQSFGMHLIAFDPFVSPDYAHRMGVKLLTLEELLTESDFVTLHLPLTATSRNLIGAKELSRMKPDARLINVARGDLIDEGALLNALQADSLGGVALDVFAEEPPGPSPLLEHPKVVATPHLGASTQEAQREVAIEAAEQVLAVLNGEPARHTVNAHFMPPEVHAVLAPYVTVASVVGRLLTSLAEGQFVGVTIRYEGEITQHDTATLKAAVLAGLLGPVTSGQVNLINASRVAQERGLDVTEQRNEVAQEYASLVSATVETTEGQLTMAGTSMRNDVHIVKVDDYWLDIVPSVPYLLFVDNQDQPGSIGAVGTVAGRHNINISFMEVGRLSLRDRAMMILGLDDPVPSHVLAEIRSLPQIYNARLVTL